MKKKHTIKSFRLIKFIIKKKKVKKKNQKKLKINPQNLLKFRNQIR